MKREKNSKERERGSAEISNRLFARFFRAPELH